MNEAGLQVFFIRRAGFGRTTALPRLLLSSEHIDSGSAQVTEATIINYLLDAYDLTGAVLLTIGTAGPIGVRLISMSTRIRFSIFANPAFNQDKGDGFKPGWLNSMLEEAILNRPATRLASRGFKFQLKRNFASFYRNLLQRSDGDLHYLDNYQSDYEEASRVLSQVSSDTFFYHFRSALSKDAIMKDGFFRSHNAVATQGTQTTEMIARNLKEECRRLAIPIEYHSSGYRMLPYTSPGFLLGLMGNYAGPIVS